MRKIIWQDPFIMPNSDRPWPEQGFWEAAWIGHPTPGDTSLLWLIAAS